MIREKSNYEKILDKAGKEIYNLNYLECPFCHSKKITKNGRLPNGTNLQHLFKCKSCKRVFKGEIQPIPMFKYLLKKNTLTITEKRIFRYLVEHNKQVFEYLKKQIKNNLFTKYEKEKIENNSSNNPQYRLRFDKLEKIVKQEQLKTFVKKEKQAAEKLYQKEKETNNQIIDLSKYNLTNYKIIPKNNGIDIFIHIDNISNYTIRKKNNKLIIETEL